MSNGINKVILIGHLGKDPEMRQSNSGAVANLSLATSESWKDKQTGEKQERTEWHRVVFFGRLAEVAGEYLSKGKQIYVEGRLQTTKYQDKEGNDRYSTDVIGSQMQMLGGRGDDGGAVSQAPVQHNATAFDAPPAPAPASPAAPAPANPVAANPVANTNQDFDDDIPF